MKKIDNLIIANKKYKSRLIVGTGKYKSMSECAKTIKLSGAEIVTVAVRRVNITDKKKPLLMDYIDPKKITYLPNTAGCFNSDEALRTLRLAREIGGWNLVKLEVLGDKKTLFPDMIETLKSTEVLSKEGFKVMVYCSDDPLIAKRLENCGACSIMPLAAPIGSGLGIQNQTNIKIIRDQTNLPLIIHQRNSENEIIEVLNNYKNDSLPLVMHCFTGSKKLRNFCIDSNYYISLSGIVTFKNANDLREVIKTIPLTSILIETEEL